jgi:hypothetical protein
MQNTLKSKKKKQGFLYNSINIRHQKYFFYLFICLILYKEKLNLLLNIILFFLLKSHNSNIYHIVYIYEKTNQKNYKYISFK